MNNIVMNIGLKSNYQQPAFKGGTAKKVVQQVIQKPKTPLKKNGCLTKFLDFITPKFLKPSKMIEYNPLKGKQDYSAAKNLDRFKLTMENWKAMLPLKF